MGGGQGTELGLAVVDAGRGVLAILGGDSGEISGGELDGFFDVVRDD